MWRRFLLGCLFAAGASLAAPAGQAAARRHLTVAAAADLRYALEALIAAFKPVEPDIDVAVSYGSSGVLYGQLVNRAPFDVFLSADLQYPHRLVEQGLAASDGEFTYAVGHLAVWIPSRTHPSIDVDRDGLAVLSDPAIAHIAIANPEFAPYGRAAVAALRHDGLFERVQSKLVYAENVSQALQFVQTGAADIGLLSLSLAVAPPVAGTGRYWIVPPATYPRLDQGGVILQWASDPDAARKFRAFMTGAVGREILKRFGFYVGP